MNTKGDNTSTTILSLPIEIIVKILLEFGTFKMYSCLVRTCKYFYNELYCDIPFGIKYGLLVDDRRKLILSLINKHTSYNIYSRREINIIFEMLCEYGYVNIVERLLEDKRVDPSANDNYAIQLASSNGYLQVVERLLEDKRVEPSADDNYAIKLAFLHRHLYVVERLLEDERVRNTINVRYYKSLIST